MPGKEGMLHLEPTSRLVNMLCIEDSLIEANGTAIVVVSNTGKTTHAHPVLKKGQEIGSAYEVSMANSPDKRMDSHVHTVSSIDFELDEDLPDIDITDRSVATESKEKLEWRKRQLKSLCDANSHLLQEWRAQLLEVLTVHHNVFSLEDGEQGETS